MADLTKEGFIQLVEQTDPGGEFQLSELPEFDDDQELSEWARVYALDASADGVIIDDEEERELLVQLLEASVPLRLRPGFLLRYLGFGGLSVGCAVIEVTVDDPAADPLTLVGAQDGQTAARMVVRDDQPCAVGVRMGAVDLDSGGPVERVFGRVRAATVRSVGGTRVAVLASVFSVDLAVVLSVGEALADVLLSAQVEEDLEQVLPEIVA